MRGRYAIRLQLNPSHGLELLFHKTAGHCRALWNLALEQRRAFGCSGRSIGYYQQRGELAALKQKIPWFAEAPHHCLKAALVDLDTAFERFFSGQTDYPRFKKRGNGNGFRFKDPAQVQLVGDLETSDRHRKAPAQDRHAPIAQGGSRSMRAAPGRARTGAAEVGHREPIVLSDGTKEDVRLRPVDTSALAGR